MTMFENETKIETDIRSMYLTNLRIKKFNNFLSLKNSKNFFISDLVSIEFKILVNQVYLILSFLFVFLGILLIFNQFMLDFLDSFYNISLIIDIVIALSFILLFFSSLIPKLIFKTANDEMFFDVGFKQIKKIDALIETIEMQKYKTIK